ncbi:3-hydroxylacyl-ACP dehydratase [Sulfuriferula nivalis]|uniref:Phosphotransferase n=1 Tax=Sulfuriferula nivalis TaxID=2675298 RepID=A0A809S5B1_9PROT|nr:3-hydroxylacyl-ACP dehydratase [Sulfuriferula nivalis]BBP02398.1 phosphotransferase [Sulfuriferula nivalis]
MLNTQLNHAWIAAHIPHQYDMCLLDHVVSWDTLQIHCLANSHKLANNPLRSRDQLSCACGIEYAAQAMAIHGALLAPRDNARPRAGFLISVRGTTLHTPRLDDICDDLDIVATCIHSSADNILYQFTVHAAQQLLIDGRAAVILNAENQLQQAGTLT